MSDDSRFTDLHLIVDTHIAPKSDEEARYVSDELRRLIDTINSKEGYTALIMPHMDVGTKLKAVRLISWQVEAGTKYNRLHLHAVLSVKHTGKMLLKANDDVNITTRFKVFIKERLPWLNDPNSPYYREQTAPYVKVNLADASGKNYASKGSVKQPDKDGESRS